MVYEEYTPTSILVTGGAGFIGSHVAIKLVQHYPETKVIFNADISNLPNNDTKMRHHTNSAWNNRHHSNMLSRRWWCWINSTIAPR
jgi:nucleoside-diphosphate-sugar epimerase